MFEMFAQLLLTIKKKLDSGEMPPKYLGVFMVRANSFDNVDGKFPIGFTIWDLQGSSFPKTLGLDIAEQLTSNSMS